VGELYARYKDDNNLLIVVISEMPLLAKKEPKPYEAIFIVLALVFAGIYLYVSLSSESQRAAAAAGSASNSTL
jgi:hypothetical protein